MKVISIINRHQFCFSIFSKPEKYQKLLNTKKKVQLDLLTREEKFKTLHPKAINLRAERTKQPEPLKFKLQNLPEEHNPLLPLGNTENLPFFVARSKSSNLPVYRDYKHARGCKMTVVRKIEGDVDALLIELKKICSNADIRPRIGSLEVKGLHKKVVIDYLTRLGF